MQPRTIAFTVSYEVLASVDHHPCGRRTQGVLARNWIEACDKMRSSYGPGTEDRIRIDAVETRDADCRRVYHYDRFGRAA